MQTNNCKPCKTDCKKECKDKNKPCERIYVYAGKKNK